MSKNVPAAAEAPRRPESLPSMPKVFDPASEEARARATASRLGLPYVDLWTFRVDCPRSSRTARSRS